MHPPLHTRPSLSWQLALDAEPCHLPAQLEQLGLLLSGETWPAAPVDSGLANPAPQIRLTEPQIPGHMGNRPTAFEPQRNRFGLEFNDLLFDAVSGRGRSAHRSARTVFEHLLNLIALREPSHRTRFMRHSLVGTQLAAAWNPIELFLSGKPLKVSRHRQKKLLRDSRKELEKAIAKYGNGFRRQWHPETVRDRAVAAQFEREYEFFRAASAAVHGAASAMEDAFWVVDGDPVLRVGPSVVMCPSALAAGLLFIKQFFVELRSELGVDTTAILGALERLGESIGEFCAYTNGVEEYLFAADGLKRPPIGPTRLDV